MAPSPEAMAIARLVDRYPVNPRPQGRLAAEAMDGSKDPKEYFLRQVERLVAIPQQVDRQLDDHPLMFSDELGTRRFFALGTPLHEGRFATGNV